MAGFLAAVFLLEGETFLELEDDPKETARLPDNGAGLIKKIGNALNPHGGHKLASIMLRRAFE